MASVLFSSTVCILCVALGWFAHKIYLRQFVYRPGRYSILRFTRRYPRRLRLSKALRKINRKTSFVKKADRARLFDELLDEPGAL